MDIQVQIDTLKTRLVDWVGCSERDVQVVYSPLRISPLGAHVDHQDGLVTGMTLDQVILLAFVPRTDRRIRVQSMNFDGIVEFEIDDVPPKATRDWGNYVRGAVLALQETFDLKVGMDAIVEGKLPIGGLSSSAAVGVAYLLALEAVNELDVAPRDNIQHDRYIENVYLGLKNGILDQSVILMSDREHLTYLDCQSVHFEKYPIPAGNGGFEILVAYSGLAKSLVGTDYNNRVIECQQGAKMMLEWAGEPVPQKPRLRMVSDEIYAQYQDRLPSPIDRRVRHFFTEVQRVRDGVETWKKGDLKEMGRLINASGASSIHNYESGCPHLVTLYNILKDCPGVYGARFSGGGFRGSCIGLVDPTYRQEIVAAIDRDYPVKHPDVADQYSVHFCRPDGPARIWNGTH
ncbi:MAG: hypothetical protein JXA89_15435 [Anaerolineae bacterium]|nr:hypothetical protein [Anaerolineae bacterium]